ALCGCDVHLEATPLSGSSETCLFRFRRPTKSVEGVQSGSRGAHSATWMAVRCRKRAKRLVTRNKIRSCSTSFVVGERPEDQPRVMLAFDLEGKTKCTDDIVFNT